MRDRRNLTSRALVIVAAPAEPRGVNPPSFLNPNNRKTNDDDLSLTEDDEGTEAEPEEVQNRSRSRRGRARKTVDYSEMGIDDDGYEVNGKAAGRKRKQSKKTSKTSKKKEKRGSDDESDYADDESSIDLSDPPSDDEAATKKGEPKGDDASDDDTFATAQDDEDSSDAEDYQPKNGKSWESKRLNWDEIELNVKKSDLTVETERRIAYRRAAATVHKYLQSVDGLDLPPNPLDELLNKLGGESRRKPKTPNAKLTLTLNRLLLSY